MPAPDLRSDETKYFDESIKRAVLRERERCARIAEDYPLRQNPDGKYIPTASVIMCWREIAEMIRKQ